MFEKAAKGKYRFPVRGTCNTEDLYDLSDDELEDLFRALNELAESKKGERLFAKKTRENEILTAKLAIVKRVAETRLQEREARENAIANAARSQKLLGILAKKRDEDLEGMSVEQLQRMINELE